MKKAENLACILLYVLAIVTLLLIPACSGAIFLKDGTEISRDGIGDWIQNSPGSDAPFPVEFFYSTSCGSCRDAREFLLSYQRKHPSVQVEFRNLVLNGENKELFNTYKNQFRYEKISYPAVFIGDIGITGSSDIIHATDVVVNAYQNR